MDVVVLFVHKLLTGGEFRGVEARISTGIELWKVVSNLESVQI
jgi:hypothetical protein